MSSKRYQLHKFDGGAGPPPCAFFATEKGCKSGDACKFKHVTSDKQNQVVQQEVSFVTTAVVDEEDMTKKRKHKKDKEGKEEKKHKAMDFNIQNISHQPCGTNVATMITQPQATPLPVVNTPNHTVFPPKEKSSKKKRKEKEKHGVGDSSVPPGFQQQFPHNGLSSSQFPISPFSPNTVKKEEDEDASFLFGVVNTAITQGHSEIRPQSDADATGIFVQRNEVGQRLQTSGTDHATFGSSNRKSKKQKSTAPLTLPSTSSNNIAPALQLGVIDYPVAKFDANSQKMQQQQYSAQSLVQQQLQTLAPPPVNVDERAINWRPIVQSTVSNPRFAKDYNFSVDQMWVKAKKYGDWCINLPPVVAIDCEMCESSDPVTGLRDSNTLVRFSMVNGLNPSEVIVDSLVNPLLPITDMRTHVHGISEDAIRNVQFTLRHAQAIMMNTISDRTVIVGHALHHDLKSLKFSHHCVADTSYLYSLANEPNAAPSLRDCAQQILKKSLSPLHDSIEDAQIALSLAMHIVTHGTQPPIVRLSGSNGGENKAALLIHRIPQQCSADQIKRMFAVNAYVIPKTIVPIQHPAGKDPSTNVGRTDAVFESIEHAELAFATLPGPDRPDKSNRSQKRVYLQGGGYICVRKY